MILNTHVTGDGPPVLLLHGLFGAARNLGALARGLEPQAQIFAMDLRNHGESPHASGMDYATLADDVAATMAAHGLPSARIVGHSMGGKVAMMLALAQPALVKRLAVLDIAPMTYEHHYDAYVRAMQAIPLASDLSRQQADAMLAKTVPDKPLRAFLLNNLVLGERPRWRIALPELGAAMPELMTWRDPPDWLPYAGPALFLRGGNSDYVSAPATSLIAARFADSRIETIECAGHWLHAEQPAAIVAALEAFLFP